MEQNAQKITYPSFSMYELSGNIQSDLTGVHVIAAHTQENIFYCAENATMHEFRKKCINCPISCNQASHARFEFFKFSYYLPWI